MTRFVSAIGRGSLIALLIAAGFAHAEQPPDILLFSIDTLRPDNLGCYGYARDTSPHIDRLAEEGVLFETAYSTFSHTLPTMLSMTTGTNPTRRGITEISWKQLGGFDWNDYTTLPAALKKQGYTTAFVTNHWGLSEIEHRPAWDHTWRGATENAAQLVDAAIRWLDSVREQSGDGPIFLWFHVLDPHSPYTPPAPYGTQFHLDETPEEGFEQWYTTLEWRERGRGGLSAVQDRVLPDKPGNMAYLIAQYDGEIAYTDAEFARLRTAFESVAKDDPVIAFTADHGEAFGEHELMFHGHTAYEHQVRAPLILVAPGHVEPGTRSNRLAVNFDLYPTLLRLAGASLPDDLDAVDLLDLLRQDDDAPPRTIVCAEGWTTPHVFGIGIRQGSDKIITRISYGTVMDAQWYDLATDPKERINLAPKPDAVPQQFVTLVDELVTRATDQNARHKADSGKELDEETIRILRSLGYLD